MITIRTLIAIGGVAIYGVVTYGLTGCAQPGVIEQHDMPVKKDAGTKDAKAPAADEDEDEGDAEDESPVTEDEDPPPSEDEDPPPEDEEPAASVDAGKKPDTTKTDAGSGKADAGTAPSDDEPGPCPEDYMCQDPAKALTDLGLDGTVTDADEKPLALACGKGGQETCDPKDPKKSCPQFPNAFCAHVKIGGLLATDLYNCAQLCSP